jgi:membrane protein implicated in regulation of membrane protease activity
VSGDAARPSARFEPLRPASRKRLILGLVFGPVLWLIFFIVTAIVVHYSNAIALGLLVALASLVIAFAALALTKRGRDRQEARHVDGS